MDTQVREFIEKARAHGLSDDEIKQKMAIAGWQVRDIADAFDQGDLVPPPPPPPHHALGREHEHEHEREHPIAVVENLTPRGFEYKIFLVLLLVAIIGLISLANLMLSSYTTWEAAAFPVTMLIVCAPAAAFMFLRLRRTELAQPRLRKDPSRRRIIQAIQLLTFLAVIVHTIILLYMLISGHYASSPEALYRDSSAYYYGDDYQSEGPNLLKDIVRWLVTLVVAGGTFLYYWRDEHRRS
jgi:hypothetical protein